MHHDKTPAILHSLIHTLKDGQEGYRLAAESCTDPDLKQILFEISLHRAKFAGELQELVRAEGVTYEHDATVLGKAHRGWMQLKTSVSGDSDLAVLEECDRGDESAAAVFHEALDGELPAHVRSIVLRQSANVEAAQDHVRSLLRRIVAAAV